jgi:hypothetical protein
MGIFGNLFKSQPQSEEEAKKSSQMIENLKKYRGEETGKWLSMMQRDPSLIPKPSPKSTIADVDRRDTLDEAPYTPPVSAQYTTMSYQLDDLTAKVGGASASGAMLNWVNKLFAEFAVQAAAFNSSAQGTHLVVTVHAPEIEWQEAKLDEYTPEKKVSGFRGYLATLQWGMLIQGSASQIDVFIVPSEEILTFELHGLKQSGFTPFMTIDTSEIDTKGTWHIGGSAITFDTITLLAQELLGDLVRVATGSMNESELFAQPKSGLKLGETVAQGYPAPAPTRSASGQVGYPSTAASAAPPSATATGVATLDSSIERMVTWVAASQLLQAIDQDMPWLTQLKADIDEAKNRTDSARLEDLITKLRTVSGQIGGLVATYHPPKGSKYHPS